MKFFAVFVAVSSIYGLAQSIAIAPTKSIKCPLNCVADDKDVLRLVKKHFPKVLDEIEKTNPILPSGVPTSKVLSSIGSLPDPVPSTTPKTENVNATDELPGVKIPHVVVADPTDFLQVINSLPKEIPASTIDKLISEKPKTLNDAITIISKLLGDSFKKVNLNAPINSKKLTKALREIKKRGVKTTPATLISEIVKTVKPEETDPHRLYKIIKFLRNCAKKDPKYSKFFIRMLPYEEVSHVPNWHYRTLVSHITRYIPETRLARELAKGDCGCFDFSGDVNDEPIVEITSIEVPDSTPVSNALDSLPAEIPINKLISQKPKTIFIALNSISEKLGKSFKNTKLPDLPIDTDKVVADLQNAAKGNAAKGRVSRYDMISILIRNLEASRYEPDNLFKLIKFFRAIVKQNPKAKGIFSGLLPPKHISNVLRWSSKDLIAEIIKNNPQSLVSKGLTGNLPKDTKRKGSNGGKFKNSQTVGGSKQNGNSSKIGIPAKSGSSVGHRPTTVVGKNGAKIGPRVTSKIGIPAKSGASVGSAASSIAGSNVAQAVASVGSSAANAATSGGSAVGSFGNIVQSSSGSS